MKTLLILLAILLIAAGVAVGLINIFSPGTVTVGLNLDVAATLFTGGCVLLGLGVVAGSLSAMTRREVNDDLVDDYRQASPVQPDLPDFMAPASAGAAAAVATGAGAFRDGADNTAEAVTGVVDDLVDDAQPEVEPAHEEADNLIFGSTTGTTADNVEDAVDDVVDNAADKADDDLSSFFAKPADTAAAPEADTPPVFTAAPDKATISDLSVGTDPEPDTGPETSGANDDAGTDSTSIFLGSSSTGPSEEAADVTADVPEAETEAETVTEVETKSEVEAKSETEETAADAPETSQEPASEQDPADDNAPEALPQEDELFVVEERVIRERPARLLSDGTVEAETDEGWMRFENVEHVEEYLDAMRATA